MAWYQWMMLSAFAVCLVLFLYKFFYLLKLGVPKDLSEPAGSASKGVLYSCTTAMLPGNKESAYLHLPTYSAGILYHIGIFLSFAAFIWFILTAFFSFSLPFVINQILAVCLFIAAFCGFLILMKRIFNKESRELSTMDDYISNFLVTGMLVVTALVFIAPGWEEYYAVVMTLLFLWLPFGKTRHLLYFFFARYHLGYFYGRRGSWPVAKI